MKDDAVDEEYQAELERAYRSVSVGCMLFMVGLAGVAIALLILANFFNTSVP